MPTMRDVADAAGVSLMTVSRAFYRASLLKEETRERVLAAASRMGYRPNAVARSMVTGRTMDIGFVANRWLSPLSAEVDFTAAENGYSVVYVQVNDASADEEAIRIERLIEQRVDGVISASGSHVTDHSALRLLQDANIPLVTFNRYDVELPCSQVFADYAGGVRDAVQYLVDLGHERIAFVGGSPDHPQRAVREQIQGYRQAMAANGLSADGLGWFGDFTVEEGERLAQELFGEDQTPTAVVAVNDETAAGVLRAAHGLGLRLPHDLSVVGCDDTVIAPCTTPALTSVTFPFVQAARETVRLLVDRITTGSGVTATVFLRRLLVERESCCPPADDRRR